MRQGRIRQPNIRKVIKVIKKAQHAAIKKNCRKPRVGFRQPCIGILLFGNSFEPFDHGEHSAHGDGTYYEEYAPALPDRNSVVKQRTYPQKQISNSGCTEPQTLAEPLHVFGSHFGNERKPQRRDEQFCNREEEIKHNKYPRTNLYLLTSSVKK